MASAAPVPSASGSTYVIGVALSRRSIERAGRKEIPFSKSTLSKRVFGQP